MRRTRPPGNQRGTGDAVKVAVGCSVGATIETYDFIGFGTAAALYLGAAFFPGSDPLSASLLSFATLGVGFAARPLGGVLAGQLGDRIGRKPVLVGSFLLMGIATVLIGCLPTYAQAGAWAPVLLVAVRVVQGLAFGGEWGGAILMTFEHAPQHRRGLYTGLAQAGFPVGLLLANLAFLLSSGLGGTWPWRVPFLLSAVLVLVGIVVRLKITESPEFTELKESGERARNPIWEVLRDDWRTVLRALCLRVVETAGYAVSVTYMLSYLKLGEAPTAGSLSLLALTTAAAIGVVATTAWGFLSDFVGRRPIYLTACAVTIAWGIPMFLLAGTGSTALIVLVFAVSYALCQNALASVQGAWFCELFTARTRTAGASLSYQISAVVAGFTPMLATALHGVAGWLGPALLFSGYGALGLVATLLTPETWKPARGTPGDAKVQERQSLA